MPPRSARSSAASSATAIPRARPASDADRNARRALTAGALHTLLRRRAPRRPRRPMPRRGVQRIQGRRRGPGSAAPRLSPHGVLCRFRPSPRHGSEFVVPFRVPLPRPRPRPAPHRTGLYRARGGDSIGSRSWNHEGVNRSEANSADSASARERASDGMGSPSGSSSTSPAGSRCSDAKLRIHVSCLGFDAGTAAMIVSRARVIPT